ncbi:FAD/NAD(P)-binding protein [Polaribacter dokdonensis]|uniref:FAD-NAD(P)-binding n=1 Tax=Polaribacter dokdonensis DSW-5 TaxID=1300348 RepID=A0A0M9CEN2_9FLAO|nr:FAD/NAD(P)-binding domain-containing protein [Polaribacter dokdonensis]KOY50629.1 hypothetical protein I602_189 [Polaribacter dokdonensis DSW-5]SEE61946.1 FAD-NAD(P)-binding [Polaribacter dokdonensis DSW-5]
MKKLGIVGFGPRGLNALEMLFLELSKQKNQLIAVHIFESEEELGAGQVWNTKQSTVNWTNITVRALRNLKGRPEIILNGIEIPSYPSYIDSLSAKDREALAHLPDQFPPRREIGKYLKNRAKSILEVLQQHHIVKVHKTFIADINLKDNEFHLLDLSGNNNVLDEVLLTIGHQTTKLSEDLKAFEIDGLESKKTFFSETYPIDKIIKAEATSTSKNIAIRGFGLAMIDAVRALTIEKGGKFKIIDKKTFASKFITSQNVAKKIIPYSLDGLPMVPKPLNKEIDNQFKPSEKQLAKFEKEVLKYAKGDVKAENADFLKALFAKIGVEIYKNLEQKIETSDSDEQLENTILMWFQNQQHQHECLLDTEISTISLLTNYVSMAAHEINVSLDFCVGQVIRHLQPTLYKSFSHANVSDALFADVIQFDEMMKRYSYGPPIESMQQLIALHEANILDFRFVDDPEIITKKDYWLFKKGEQELNCEVVINSVLSAPKLLEVSTPIILNLLKDDLLQPVHSKLGIETNKDGTIVLDDDSRKIPLAVLGRLAKGSVIGVDAILECFGPRIKDWAKGAVSRL